MLARRHHQALATAGRPTRRSCCARAGRRAVERDHERQIEPARARTPRSKPATARRDRRDRCRARRRAQRRLGRHLERARPRRLPADGDGISPRGEIVERPRAKAGHERGHRRQGASRGRFKGIAHRPARSTSAATARSQSSAIFTRGRLVVRVRGLGRLDVIRSALGREAVVSSARVRLNSPRTSTPTSSSVESDKQLDLKVMREADYFDKQSEALSGFLRGLGIAFAIMFSLAAMIGAAITMNGAVAHRRREIGRCARSASRGFDPDLVPDRSAVPRDHWRRHRQRVRHVDVASSASR